MRCCVCDATFTTKVVLIGHLAKEHPEWKMCFHFKCKFATKDLAELYKHDRDFHIFRCPSIRCRSSFDTKDKLCNHLIQRCRKYICAVPGCDNETLHTTIQHDDALCKTCLGKNVKVICNAVTCDMQLSETSILGRCKSCLWAEKHLRNLKEKKILALIDTQIAKPVVPHYINSTMLTFLNDSDDHSDYSDDTNVSSGASSPFKRARYTFGETEIRKEIVSEHSCAEDDTSPREKQQDIIAVDHPGKINSVSVDDMVILDRENQQDIIAVDPGKINSVSTDDIVIPDRELNEILNFLEAPLVTNQSMGSLNLSCSPLDIESAEPSIMNICSI